MAAVTMHHFSGPSVPFVRSRGTVSGGVFKFALGMIKQCEYKTLGHLLFILLDLTVTVCMLVRPRLIRRPYVFCHF